MHQVSSHSAKRFAWQYAETSTSGGTNKGRSAAKRSASWTLDHLWWFVLNLGVLSQLWCEQIPIEYLTRQVNPRDVT